MSLRRTEVLLVVSIALNVFMIGAALTIYALHLANAPAKGGQRSWMRAAAASLDEAHETAFLQLLRGQGQTIQAETRSARAIRDDAWAALGREDFDALAVKRRLAQARELNVLAHSTIEDAVVDFAIGLTPAQRASFSQAMRRGASHEHMDSSNGRPNTP